jgi:hypothetical protein
VQVLTIFLRKLWKNSYFHQFNPVCPTQLTFVTTHPFFNFTNLSFPDSAVLALKITIR